MKILLVEDAEDQQRLFEDSVEFFNEKYNSKVEYEIFADISAALNNIDGSFDGAIIDLWLGFDKKGGNELLHQLGLPFTRIPVIFVTAFLDSVDDHPSVIKKRTRDESTYESDLLLFQKIFDTGLTRIMGGRGEIEIHLTQVFLKNLLPQLATWVSYGKEDSARTERALLRYALNHLFELLEEGEDRCFPEEVYLHPPMSDNITTGSIVKDKTTDRPFVILSPACDLVVRGENGRSNTEQILLVDIESMSDALKGSRKKDRVESLVKNKHQYFHWLPPTVFFEGGVLNFRKLHSLAIDEFDDKFEIPSIQISPPFVKDIVSRFSSYYARQGQPDIDSSDFVACYTQQQTTEQ